MNFKCEFCKHTGKIGTLEIDNEDMLSFSWYKFRGFRRYGVYCSKCGTIHLSSINFFRLPLFILKLKHPYKTIRVITIVDLGIDISDIVEKYSINCREAYIFVYGLNDLLLEKMRKLGHVGECYDSPLTMNEYEFLKKTKGI